MWFGTFDGLSRFDGNEFVNYRHSPEDSTSLPPNEVRNICVDRHNNVWVLNYVVSRFDRVTEQFITYPLNGDRNDVQGDIDLMTMDKDCRPWVHFNDKVYRYCEKEDHFIPVRIVDKDFKPLRMVEIIAMNFDEKGFFWCISAGKAISFRMDQDKVSGSTAMVMVSQFSFSDRSQKHFFFFNPAYRVLRSEAGLFIFSNTGLYRLDSIRGTFNFNPSVPDDLSLNGCPSNAWCENSGRIRVWDARKNMIHSFSPENFVQLEWNLIDKDGTYWLGGPDKTGSSIGVIHVIPRNNLFTHYFPIYKGKSTAVFAIMHEKGRGFWVGFRSQDYAVHLSESGSIDASFPSYLFRGRSKGILGEKVAQVRSIAKDFSGTIWFGFLSDYQWFRKHLGKTFLKFSLMENNGMVPLLNNSIRQILRLKSNILLIGGDRSLYLVDPVNLSINASFMLPDHYLGLFSTFEDEKKNIWTGCGHSLLCRFDQKLNLIDTIKLSKDPYNVEGITGTSDTLWIAIMGGGLVRYIIKQRAARFYTALNGLSNNYAYHISRDKHGNLWISTNEGLSMFNPRTEIFMNFGESDGLRIREFNADAGYQDDDGRLYFGGMGGFTGFYPDSLYSAKGKALKPLLITGISVSGQKFYPAVPVYNADTVVLGKGDNNIRLTFARIDTRYPEEVTYRYMIPSIDGKWTRTKADNRIANYAGLTYGTYKFIIEAADGAGNWQQRRELTIIIPPFFYQTILFKVSVGLVILMIIAIFFRMKYKQVKLINLKRQETQRMQSLQSQLNPHFIFNALNSIGYLIPTQTREEVDQYIADFASLMRSFLDNSTRDYISLADEIDSINSYLRLEQLRLKDKFDYRLELSKDIEPEAVEIVPSLIQPFIENAIWHGVGLLKNRKGKIVISFRWINPGRLACIVEDDGIGRARSAAMKTIDYSKRQSRGVNLIRDRIESYNKLHNTNYEIIVGDQYPGAQETGTRVIVPLPVNS